MDAWCRVQIETYLLVGIFLPVFIGFLVGSAVALATGAALGWLPPTIIGTGVTVWAWIILLRNHYA